LTPCRLEACLAQPCLLLASIVRQGLHPLTGQASWVCAGCERGRLFAARRALGRARLGVVGQVDERQHGAHDVRGLVVVELERIRIHLHPGEPLCQACACMPAHTLCGSGTPLTPAAPLRRVPSAIRPSSCSAGVAWASPDTCGRHVLPCLLPVSAEGPSQDFSTSLTCYARTAALHRTPPAWHGAGEGVPEQWLQQSPRRCP